MFHGRPDSIKYVLGHIIAQPCKSKSMKTAKFGPGLSLPFLLTTGCGISGDNIKEMPSSSYISTSMGIIQKGLGSYILF